MGFMTLQDTGFLQFPSLKFPTSSCQPAEASSQKFMSNVYIKFSRSLHIKSDDTQARDPRQMGKEEKEQMFVQLEFDPRKFRAAF